MVPYARPPPGATRRVYAPRLHKDALDAATNRLFDIREVHAHEQAEADLARAIEAFDPTAVRRGHAKCKGADVPVLPQGRQKDSVAGAGGRR